MPLGMRPRRALARTEAMMDQIAVHQDSATSQDWPVAIYRTLKEFGVAQLSYVPDADIPS